MFTRFVSEGVNRVLQLELAEKRKELPQTMEVEKTSQGPMETNIDPRLQEDESIVGPIEALVDV